MKNNRKFFPILLFPLIILTACAQKSFVEQGSVLSTEKVSKIVEGSTTQSQVLEIFGEPTTKTVINDNETQWTYKYTQKSSTRYTLIGETQYNIIEGKLDIIVSKGIVTWYNYDENRKQKKW